MKHARKALTILFLFVTPLLLSGFITSMPTGDVMVTTSLTPTKVSVPSYEEQTPILAFSDVDMDNYASALSWEGNGMPDTPYIIEGYNITDDADCILIQDTTRAFEIRNCYISSFGGSHGNGIVISNASQVGIYDTLIQSKSDAIIMSLVPAPQFDNVTIQNCGTGLDMALCPGATIHDCEIFEIFGEAIRFIECNNTMISENQIHDTIIGSGIQFHLSHHVTVVNNHISHCAASGVWVVYSPHATIENNDIHDNDWFTGPMCGIHLDNSDHASVVGNEIYHNSRNGIYVQESDWVYVFDNEIYDNSDHGIDVMFSVNGTILQNEIYGNGYWPVIVNALCGIFLGPSIDFVISENTIWNNTPSGISVIDALRIEISNNHIFNNTDTGIYGWCGEPQPDLEIFDNEIHHNGFLDTVPSRRGGIVLENYEDCYIHHNLVYNNTDYGISFWGDNNRAIGNVVHDSETGIATEECYDNLLSENIVYNCLGGILVVNVGSNVTHNIVYDNEYGIFMDSSGHCLIYGNDVGWNTINGFERNTFPGQPLIWDDNVSIGNHWHDYDGGGTYDIVNNTDVSNIDRFPSISLNLTETDPIAFEILETGNVIEWEAYALNPSHYEILVDGESVLVEEWDGGNIEYLADGLAHGTHTIGIEVFHISGHSMENGTTADIEDLTPPAIDGQAHVVITFGDTVSVQFTAVDPSEIASWAVNDTINFAISSTGLLTNMIDLPVGDYVVVATATDIYGNTGFADITITVHPVTDGGLTTTMILLAGAGGAVVIVVVVVVLLKKKQT